MELNKRKSLLTPAAPTVWGMIHGDIANQQDIVDMISAAVDKAVGSDLPNRIKGEVLAEINPILGEALSQKQPTLVSGENIKSLSGRSLLGEGDLDPLTETDRTLLNSVEDKATQDEVQGALMKSSAAQNMARNALDKTNELDAKIGDIDTITQDILA